MSKKVVIVGAGPAGWAAAYSLQGKADVTLIDAGKNVAGRVEDHKIDNGSSPYGMGGAGTFSDGKFIFETLIGKRATGSNLYELIGKDKEKEYFKRSREMFEHYFGSSIEIPNNTIMSRAREIDHIAAKNDMDYLFALQHHIGTDKLPGLMQKIEDELKTNGVDIVTEERILDFDSQKVYSNNNEYDFDYLLLAPGRGGSMWLENILNEKKIDYGMRTIDIGVRVETDAHVLEHLTLGGNGEDDKMYGRDVKLSFRRPNGDLIRTFCVCPNGQVTRLHEKDEDRFNLVNGASDSGYLSPNTNFALLISMPLKENGKSNEYGERIAQLYHNFGLNDLTLQRLGDLKAERRSREDRIHEWRINPTLEDVNIGDITGAMPYRIMRGLLEGIERLSAPGLMEGLNQDSTLLYAPEIKFHGINIKTDQYLQTTMPNVYVAGDGSGTSRGIGGAAASGLVAGEGILKQIYDK